MHQCSKLEAPDRDQGRISSSSPDAYNSLPLNFTAACGSAFRSRVARSPMSTVPGRWVMDPPELDHGALGFGSLIEESRGLR